MSVGSADIQKALVALWSSSGLDTKFKNFWDSGVDHASYLSLHDSEAAPGQVMPYCVYSLDRGRVVGRSSGVESTKHALRELPVTFTIHATAVSGDSRSAKEIAAYLVEELMKVFGGHPTETSSLMSLSHGGDLGATYVSDWSNRTELYRWSWVLNYLLLVDVPEAL